MMLCRLLTLPASCQHSTAQTAQRDVYQPAFSAWASTKLTPLLSLTWLRALPRRCGERGLLPVLGLPGPATALGLLLPWLEWPQ